MTHTPTTVRIEVPARHSLVETINFTWRAINAHDDLVEALQAAVARIEVANKEGDPILSAWLPDARAALAKARGES